MSTPVTDPIILEDIEAAFAADVYHAARLHALRLAGKEAPPEPSREDRIVLRRVALRAGLAYGPGGRVSE